MRRAIGGLRRAPSWASKPRFKSGASVATAALTGTGLAMAASSSVHSAQCDDDSESSGGWVEDAAVGGVVLTVMSGIGYLVYSAVTSEGPPKSEEQKQQEAEQVKQQQEAGKQQMKAAFVKEKYHQRREYGDAASAAKAFEVEFMKQLVSMRIIQLAQRSLMRQPNVAEKLASGAAKDQASAAAMFETEFEESMILMQQHATGQKEQMLAAFVSERLKSGEAKDEEEAGRLFEVGFATLVAEAEAEAASQLAAGRCTRWPRSLERCLRSFRRRVQG